MQTFVYPAKIVYIYDAGTFEAIVDLGFKVHYKARLRLKEFVLPDPHDIVASQQAKRFVMDIFLDKRAIVRTSKQGREWLADVFLPGTTQRFQAAEVKIDGTSFVDMKTYVHLAAAYDFDASMSDWVVGDF